MKDLLIDIEALGLRPGSAIVQLAAVLFDSSTGETGDEIHLYIQPEKQDPWHADLDTLAWHQKQGTFPHPPEVAEFIAMPAGDAIDCFLSFLADLSDAGHEIQTVWSWGATYDFPLLDPYWERYATGGEAPWAYYIPRCARTVWQVAFPGVKHAKRPHHALDDCKAAIADLCMALSHLKGNATP